MQELKIEDTAISGIPDQVAAEIVKTAKAAGGRRLSTKGSGVLLEKLPGGLCLVGDTMEL